MSYSKVPIGGLGDKNDQVNPYPQPQTFAPPKQNYSPPSSSTGQPYYNPPNFQLGNPQSSPAQSQYSSNSAGATNYSPGTTASNLPVAPARGQVKEVVLKNGIFEIELPLAESYLKRCRFTDSREFTHLRYTAATCDANDFADQYTLRQSNFRRLTKIAVVATMYNEDDELFCKSMSAVFENIKFLCDPNQAFNWGKDGWKNIVVVIVSDGRTKINKRVLTVLGCMGIYMDNMTKSSVNGTDVTAHIFECTTQVCVGTDLMCSELQDQYVPVQTIFLLKEKNAKKINSHRWFFNAVCKLLNPEITILLDIGTRPTKQSFFHLYRAFTREGCENVGGACGEIAAELGSYQKKALMNPLVATQNFEYKMSNILDKPLESMFGYISVLPGAFSAYRYKALQGVPLDLYFKGETMHGGADLFSANMYLAEDRILCFELVTKRGESWVLRYVKSAKAETDVPDSLPELISQRRRWLNGSFFAAVHALMNFRYIARSGHTQKQKIALYIEFFYIAVNMAFSWFSIANFYLSFYFMFDVTKGSTNENGVLDGPELAGNPYYPYGGIVFQLVNNIYAGVMVMIFVASMGNRPQGSKILYYGSAICFAFIMALMLFNGGWTIVMAIRGFEDYQINQTKLNNSIPGFFSYFFRTATFRDICISTISTYGLYLLSSIIHLDFIHCFSSMIQYLFLLPAYVNIFMIYSFTNLHDVSWGTKGDNQASSAGVAIVAKKTSDGKDIVHVEIDDAPASVNQGYINFQKTLDYQKDNRVTDTQKRDAKTKQEDYFKLYRTRVVLLWLLCNGLVVSLMTNDAFSLWLLNTVQRSKNTSQGQIHPYLTFIFWSVAILSFIRFCFSTAYMIQFSRETASDAGKRDLLKGDYE